MGLAKSERVPRVCPYARRDSRAVTMARGMDIPYRGSRRAPFEVATRFDELLACPLIHFLPLLGRLERIARRPIFSSSREVPISAAASRA